MADQGLGQTSYSSLGMNQTSQVGNIANSSPSSASSPPYSAPSQLPMTPSGPESIGSGFFAEHRRTIMILLIVALVVCSVYGVYHFFFKGDSESFRNTDDERRNKVSQDLQSPYAAY